MNSGKRGVLKTGLLLGIFLSALVAQLPMGTALAQPAQNCPCSFTELAEAASPSVVNISSMKVVRGGPFRFDSPFGEDDPLRDFFEKFFGQKLPKEHKQKGLGSGVIIDPEGYILTNNHVVEATDQILVKVQGGKEFKAKMVGRDPQTDLALIKIEPETPLPALRLGDSEQLKVGDWVLAIGSPFGLVSTVTAGIVSAKYRRIGIGAYDDFIQTDASINPGNSGGPLLNMRGEVVGITTAIFSRSGGNIGIGFAIPSNIARDLIPQLRKGKVVRGWLGVMIQQITPQIRDKLGLTTDSGALVSQVTPGGPAEKAGIRRGDVIVSFGDQPIKDMNDLPFLVAKSEVGKKVPVTVIRKGEKRTFQVTIGQMKEEEEAEVPMEETGIAPDLGLSLENLSPELASRFKIPEQTGVLITKVEQGSAADQAGLRPGDVVLEVEQEEVRSSQEFTSKMAAYPRGQAALLLINRKGTTLYLTLPIPK
jgi:serine protease Do